MNDEYMFLTSILPSSNNLKDRIDVFLQSIIIELKMLWEVGVQTYDVSMK